MLNLIGSHFLEKGNLLLAIQCKLRISIRSVEAISMFIGSYAYAKIKYYYVNYYKKTLTYAIDIA